MRRKWNRISSRIIAFVLAFLLVFSLDGMSVFAEEAGLLLDEATTIDELAGDEEQYDAEEDIQYQEEVASETVAEEEYVAEEELVVEERELNSDSFSGEFDNQEELYVNDDSVLLGASKYSSNWKEWDQKDSGISKMQESGCYMVSYSKMLAEAGFNVENPDKFYEWEKENGYISGTISYVEGGLVGYVKAHGGTATEHKEKLSGNVETDKATILKYIKEGKYVVVLSDQFHMAYIAQQESITKNKVIMYDSSKIYGNGTTCVCEYNGKSGSKTFGHIRVYTIDYGKPSISSVTLSAETSEYHQYDVAFSHATRIIIKATAPNGMVYESEVDVSTWTPPCVMISKIKYSHFVGNDGVSPAGTYHTVYTAYNQYGSTSYEVNYNRIIGAPGISAKQTKMEQGKVYLEVTLSNVIRIALHVTSPNGVQYDFPYDYPECASGTFTKSMSFNFDSNDPEGKYIYYYTVYNNLGQSASYVLNVYYDFTPPTGSNVRITNVSDAGYTVLVDVADNAEVSYVQFPTWTEANGQDDLPSSWPMGDKISGNTYSYTVKTSDHNNEHGKYLTHIYATDKAGNMACVGTAEVYGEINPPTVSDLKIKDVSRDGYTVECSVTDSESGISKVQFPTWTLADGQDDLFANWNTNSACSGTVNGNKVTYPVTIESHNYEAGLYRTHVYAYDYSGNQTKVNCPDVEVPRDYVPVKTIINNGKIYSLYDIGCDWSSAENMAEYLVGNLVSIDSETELNLVKNLVSKGSKKKYAISSSYNKSEEFLFIDSENLISSSEDSYDVSNGFIVERSAIAEQKKTYIDFKTGNMYMYFATPMTWYDAEAFCENLGGHLVTFSSAEEESQIKSFIDLLSTEYVQIGLYKDTSWKWVTGESFEYENWREGEPNNSKNRENYGLIYSGDGNWNDGCNQPFHFICEIDNAVNSNNCRINIPEGLTIYLDESKDLQIPVTIDSEYPVQITEWISSNPNFATVDSNGFVRAKCEGTVTITAKVSDTIFVSRKLSIQKSRYTYCITFDHMDGVCDVFPDITSGTFLDSLPNQPERTGYTFVGWFTAPDGEGVMFDISKPITENMTLYAFWKENEEIPNGFWVKDVPDQVYTGSQIKPEVVVVDSDRILIKGKDYTIKYKNNIKANDGTNIKTAPTIIVTGKGNYKGSESIIFKIVQKDLSDSDVLAPNIVKNVNGKVQKVVPTVKHGKRILKNGKDFKLEYPNNVAKGGYQVEGKYQIWIRGINGYTGLRIVTLTLTSLKNLDKASVSISKKNKYTGGPICPDVTVKVGGKRLTQGCDFTVNYLDNINVGTAKVVITAVDGSEYIGKKEVSFNIEGISIAKASVTGVPSSVMFNGTGIVFGEDGLEMPTLWMKSKIESKALVKDRDYSISYRNNYKVGTATAIFSGINGYCGTKKIKFKIAPYDIQTDVKGYLSLYVDDVPYMKGGSTPEVSFCFRSKYLKEGKDFSITYKNNKSVSSGKNVTKAPTVQIVGKGNFKGKITRTFNIYQSEFFFMKALAKDVVFNPKKNGFVTSFTIKDTNGQILKAGVDYDKSTVRYSYKEDTILPNGTLRNSGDTVESTDVVPAGTTLCVTVQGNENYGSSYLTCEYRIVQRSISKVKAKIVSKEYTGKPITLTKNDIILLNGNDVLSQEEYEIVDYSNNINKGSATVTIKGCGNYGGTANLKFKIKSKGFIWWWRQ